MNDSSFRWLATPSLDIDAYQSAASAKDYGLFFIFKDFFSDEETEAQIKKFAEIFSEERGATVVVAGGAAKERDSQSSKPIPKFFNGPGVFTATESGVKYELVFENVLNPGLFVDQRENRIAASKLKAKRVLNLFSYTCAFSVVSALHGAQTLSVDSSKKYLEWGKRNFELNGVSLSNHLFFAQDAGEFLKRTLKKVRAGTGEKFDLIVLDPPTFSRSGSKSFQVQKDLPGLVEDAMALLTDGGRALVSCNDSRWDLYRFREMLENFGVAVPAPASPEFDEFHPFKGFWLTHP